MLVCGVDYETNGIDPETSYITEIGAILFDGTTWEKKASFQTLIFDERALPLSKIIVDLTGITDADVRSGRQPLEALQLFQRFSRDADCFVAHNRQFEMDFTKEAALRYNFDFGHDWLNKPWICTNEHIEHKEGLKCRKLSHMVVDYGGIVDGAKIHRSIADIELMGQLLRLIGKPMESHIEYAREPWVYIQAQTNYDQRDLAKKAGYGWETCPGTYYPKFTKKWVKRVKARDLETEKAKKEDFSRITLEEPG